MTARAGVKLVLTCEHGGNRVPARYAAVLRDARDELRTHRGYDIGALELARDLSRKLHVPLVAATTTRLLVDLNRSLDHRAVFSKWTRGLEQRERDGIVQRYYEPHRSAVRARIERELRNAERVVHIAVHSFTPILNGRVRRADIGLLCDPSHAAERAFCGRFRGELRARAPDLCVLFNSPYRGWTDGLATSLRSDYPRTSYLGIELEVNQRLVLASARKWKRVRAAIGDALSAASRHG